MKFNFKITIPRPFKKIKEVFTPKTLQAYLSKETAKHELKVCTALLVFGLSWQFVAWQGDDVRWFHWLIFVLGTWSAMYGLDRTYKKFHERRIILNRLIRSGHTLEEGVEEIESN